MIEVQLGKPHAGGRRGPGRPKLVAIFSFRYDAHLVPDLIENLRPLVDGWISFDDRGATELFSGEAERRRRLLETAREVGADWVLAVDPDERFETGLAHSLPEFLAADEPTIWTFHLRDLYTPTAYRIDGVWGSKRQGRLFPVLAWETYDDRPLHGQWAPEDPIYRVRDTGFNLYHLKMIAPARRRARRDLYAVLDPERSMQPIGYDYLADEDGADFEEIPPGRGYLPAHHDDGGLWMGETPADNSRDSPDDLIALAERLSRHGRLDQAVEVVRRAAAASPDSGVVQRTLAALAVRVGAFDEAAAAARRACALDADDAAAAQIARTVRFLRESAWVDERAPLSSIEWPWCEARRQFLTVAAGAEACIATPFVDEAVCISRGRDSSAAARLAVVVIGLGAPKSLTAAVDSLLAQSTPCEIVVVNSGGGSLRALLGVRLERVTLIETDKAAFVGAARNLGVLASHAEFVAFLAGDCLAGADWVRHRLDAHDKGAAAVASAVIHDAGGNAIAHAHHHLLFARRVPTTPAARARRYSASYRRALFEERGLFNPGLRIGEDTRFNAGLARDGIEIVWRPDVVTVHTAVTSIGAAAADLFKRGVRAGRVAPLVPVADLQQTGARRLARLLLSSARRDARDRANGARVSLTLEAATPRPRDALLSGLSVAYQIGHLVATVRLWRSSRLMAKAYAAREAGRLVRAKRLARRACRSLRHPSHIRWLSDLLTKEGRQGEALAVLSQAAAGPDATAGLFDAYVLALEKDDAATALTHARKGLAFHPTPQRFAKVARLSARLEDPAGVVQACRGAAAMAPHLPDLMRRLSGLLYSAGAKDDALRLARLAARERPDDPRVRNWLRKLTREAGAAHLDDETAGGMCRPEG